MTISLLLKVNAPIMSVFNIRQLQIIDKLILLPQYANMVNTVHTYKVEVGKFGRITLPSKLRKSYDIQEGDLLTIQETEQGLQIQTPKEAFEEIRTIVAPYLENTTSAVDEFLTLRRQEAKREETEYQQWEK